MKEYNIDVLKDAANRLLLDMSESEYETLLSEFDIVTKQMKPLGDNKELDKLEPMVYPMWEEFVEQFKKKKLNK